jgi:hypothetical protein
MSIGKLYKKLLIGIIVIFVFINCILMNGASQEESLFVLRILNSDIKIQNSYLKIEEIGKHWGTGFFVNFKDDLYIVTARHVADKNFNLTGIARIKNNKTGEIEIYKIFLPKDNWVYHPEKGNTLTCPVDVAVMKVDRVKDYKIVALDADSDFLTREYIKNLPFKRYLEKPYICKSYNWLSDYMIEENMKYNPTLPAPTFIVNNIGENILQQKYLKNKIKGQPSNNLFEDEVLFLKGNQYPGNSGAPVIDVTPFENPQNKILGVLIASEPIKVENNFIPLKFVVIEPSFRVIETLEYAIANPKEETSTYLEALKEEEY